MTWEEFVEQGKPPKRVTWEYAFILQAVAALSTQPQFKHMTPWEVFDHIEHTRQCYDGECEAI